MADITKLKALAETVTAGEWYEPRDLRFEDRKTGELHGLHHDDEYFIAAANPAAVLGLIESEQEAIELCDVLSGLLGGVAIAVRGPEEPKMRHGFSDLPSRVKTVVAERDALKAECEGLRKDAERANYWKQRAKSAEGHLHASDFRAAAQALHKHTKFSATPWAELTDAQRSQIEMAAGMTIAAVNDRRDIRIPGCDVEVRHG